METREGNTLLHIAAGTKSATLSHLLADKQCDPSAQNKVTHHCTLLLDMCSTKSS